MEKIIQKNWTFVLVFITPIRSIQINSVLTCFDLFSDMDSIDLICPQIESKKALFAQAYNKQACFTLEKQANGPSINHLTSSK